MLNGKPLRFLIANFEFLINFILKYIKKSPLMKKLFFLLFLPLLFAAGCSTSSKETKRTPPNIIFILADDHGYQAISAYDYPIGRLAPTPNIDRLAQEGMLFDRMFVANSLCGPSRASIITGKFSHKNGFRWNGDKFNPDQPTFPKMLQAAGYQTAVFGKWHLKSLPQGFDDWCVLPGQGHYYNPDFIRPPADTFRMHGYVTDLIGDMALDWLQKRDPDKPFLLMFQQKAPHREWLPPERYLDLYHKTKFPLPPTLFDDHKGMGTAAREAEMLISENMALSSDNKLDPKVVTATGHKPFLKWYFNAYRHNLGRMDAEQRAHWDKVYQPINEAFLKNPPTGDSLTKWKYQRYMEDYLACIRAVDDNVGRVLDYLKENGLDKNTIVVYTSDQGFYLGEHGWFDKRFMYEESFRTPLLVRYPPLVKPGSVNRDLVQNIDFAPTFLELAGIQIPGDIQGVSMLPLLEGKHPDNWRKSLYYHYYEFPSIHMVKRHYGIRTERYKLIHFYYDIDEWELYDLQKDPQELHNVINDPAYADVVKQMHHQLDSLIQLYQDPLEKIETKK